MGYASTAEKLDDQAIRQIFELNRQGVGLREIGRRLGVSHKSVSYRLKKNAVDGNNCVIQVNRIPRGQSVSGTGKFDWKKFSELDDTIKAYWAGFITADGYVKFNSLKIDLAVKDLTHLKWWEQFGVKVRTNASRGSCCIVATNPELIKWLNSWNVFTRKTGCEEFPCNRSADLLFAYIQGVFDGDGSAVIRQGNLACSIVSACRQFLQDISDFLRYHDIKSHVHEYFPPGKQPYSKLTIYERESLKLFGHFQRTIYLHRKLDKALSIDKSTKKFLRYDDTTKIRIVSLRNEGYSLREIAALVNKSQSGVGHILSNK